MSEPSEHVHKQYMIASSKLLAALTDHHGSPVKLVQSNVSHKPITVSISDECFAPFSTPVKARLGFDKLRLTGRELLHIVAQFYEITVADLRGPRRTKIIARARFVFYYHASQSLQLDNTAIARLTSKDQSSISQTLYAIRNQSSRTTKDERFWDEIELIGLKISERYPDFSEAAE